MSADTGGAAFPRPMGEAGDAFHKEYNKSQTGMTLLDYFAGLAMQGICTDTTSQPESWNYDVIAKVSYDIAAAMLTERARRTEGK